MPARFGRRPLRQSVIACCALGAALAFALAGSASAATTLRVDDNHAECPSAAFSTISAAIAAAAPGDRVAVCPGAYVEQVRIGKPGLQVVAAAGFAGGVFIRPPDPMSRPAAIVTLSAPATMLRGVTVLGRAPASLGPCAPDYAGVLVDSPAADLTEAPVLARDRVLDIVSRGCRSPRVPGAFANPAFPEETGDALVLDSSAVVRTTRIQGPGEEGIVVAGTNTHALLIHIFARGPALLPFPSQPQSATGLANGVDILGPGALVDIRDSEIRDFLFQFTAQADSFNIEYGVKANPGTSLRLVRSIIANGTVGVGLLGTHDAFVADNKLQDNDINILASTGASGNRILRNLALGAFLFGQVVGPADCEDDTHGSGTAGTANLWQDNVGDPGASFPPEICPPPA